MNMMKSDEWVRTKTGTFWSEIASCDHVLQIYEDNEVFMKMLAGFVGDGINAGDCVIIIATKEHLHALENSLHDHVISIETLVSDNHYIALDAEQVLARFMRNGRPDEDLFFSFVNELIARVNYKKRKMRVFGEMVALLWAEGHHRATVKLEHLWKQFCQSEPISLFCAYPKSGFTGDAADSLQYICNSHSKVISGTEKPLTEIFYRNTSAMQE